MKEITAGSIFLDSYETEYGIVIEIKETQEENIVVEWQGTESNNNRKYCVNHSRGVLNRSRVFLRIA